MKSITRYQCEVCGSEYNSVEFAQFCESTPALSACPVKPGDMVEAYERYDKPAEDEVVEVKLVPAFMVSAIKSWERDPRGLAGLKECMRGEHPELHTWAITMKDRHQYSKDEDGFSDTLDWGSVRLPGAKTWLNGREC